MMGEDLTKAEAWILVFLEPKNLFHHLLTCRPKLIWVRLRLP